MLATVQRFEETAFYETRNDEVTNGQQREENDREDHLHVRPWHEAKQTHEQQLGQLATSELMDFTLRNTTNVVVWRISGLLRKEEHNAFKHLVATETRDGNVEEQAVENGWWDVGQWIRKQKNRQADENVRKQNS